MKRKRKKIKKKIDDAEIVAKTKKNKTKKTKKKKHKKKSTLYPHLNNVDIKYICPGCLKPKKAKKLHDGYVICAWCGLVVYKVPGAYDDIDAPGFILKGSPIKTKHIKKDKHHDLEKMDDFIDYMRE